MIEKLIKTYLCEYCNKLYQRKYYAAKHEMSCKMNPKNVRLCHDCVHLSKKKYTIYYDDFEGYSERVIDLLHCKEIDSFLYPPSVEFKGNAFDLDDELNQPFKKECEYFKEYESIQTLKEYLGIK